jgi:hypothetical protein
MSMFNELRWCSKNYNDVQWTHVSSTWVTACDSNEKVSSRIYLMRITIKTWFFFSFFLFHFLHNQQAASSTISLTILFSLSHLFALRDSVVQIKKLFDINALEFMLAKWFIIIFRLTTFSTENFESCLDVKFVFLINERSFLHHSALRKQIQ